MTHVNFVHGFLYDLFTLQVILAWTVPICLMCDSLRSHESSFELQSLIGGSVVLVHSIFFMICMLMTVDLLILLPLYVIYETIRWIFNY